MSAFTLGTVLKESIDKGGFKRVLVEVAGTASYDTHGSVLNASSIGPGFSKLHGVNVMSVSLAASDKYRLAFVPGASYSPSTGLLKVRDLSAASDAEVAGSTDLSGTTWVLELVGT